MCGWGLLGLVLLIEGLVRGKRKLRLGSVRKLCGGGNDEGGAWFLRKKSTWQRQEGDAGEKCRRKKTRGQTHPFTSCGVGARLGRSAWKGESNRIGPDRAQGGYLDD